ncbi:M23 family metallopeptidase, partial [Turicibacter sp. T129]|uniref:M23 family metallopeptidase n=1 Tax=Turicibacter sp. T129 TaxID=2951141 RepID=UPI0021D4F827
NSNNKYGVKESQQSLESKVVANPHTSKLNSNNKYGVKESRQSLESKISDKYEVVNSKNKKVGKSKGIMSKVDTTISLLKVNNNDETSELTSDIKETSINFYESSRKTYQGLNSFKQFVSSSKGNSKTIFKSAITGSHYLTKSAVKASKNELQNIIEEDHGNLEYKVKTNVNVTYHRGKDVVRYAKEFHNLKRGSSLSKSSFVQRMLEIRKKNQLRKNYKIKQIISQSVSPSIKSVLTKKGLEKMTISIMSNPVLFLIGIVLALILVVIPICFSGFSSPMGAIIQSDEKQISEFHLYVSQLDQDFQNEIRSQIDGTTNLQIIYDFSNLNTNSYDLLAYFSSKYLDFKLDDIKDEIKQFHHELYTVKKDFINSELYVSIESISVNDYLTLNKDTLFNAGEYELYLLYLEYGLTIYSSELAPPYDGTYYYSSKFGYRINPTTGEQLEFHTGLDIPKPLGTPIKACMSGIVTRVAYDPNGYGNYLIIQDGNRETLYAHCEEVLVKVGQTIRVGDKIALTGSTGRSTGPHLHLEYKKDGVRLDPELYLPKID